MDDKPKLYEFHVKNNTHVRHPNLKGDGKCFGRVFRLAYPFGWRHFYCDRSCCDIPKGRDPETGEPTGGKHHVECTEDWTFTEFVYCIDCGRIGIIIDETGKTKLKVEPAWPHQ